MSHLAAIQDLYDLSKLLCRWYDHSDLSIAEEAIPEGTIVPDSLRQAWLTLGRLSVGSERWLRVGRPAPLACQDGFAAPGPLIVRDGIALVVRENQGNWAMGFEADTVLPDPPVYSDFLTQEGKARGFVPVGCALSELIITSALTETIMFGMEGAQGDQRADVESCTCTLWIGRYYNAAGYGAKYEIPSHEIRTNEDKTVMALFWGGAFSGFWARAADGRQALAALL